MDFFSFVEILLRYSRYATTTTTKLDEFYNIPFPFIRFWADKDDVTKIA